jgi:hypothetical protein
MRRAARLRNRVDLPAAPQTQSMVQAFLKGKNIERKRARLKQSQLYFRVRARTGGGLVLRRKSTPHLLILFLAQPLEGRASF